MPGAANLFQQTQDRYLSGEISRSQSWEDKKNKEMGSKGYGDKKRALSNDGDVFDSNENSIESNLDDRPRKMFGNFSRGGGRGRGGRAGDAGRGRGGRGGSRDGARNRHHQRGGREGI